MVFLHGLVETERSWFRGSTSAGDFGARLATDLGASPVYVRYNSVRHVSDNGDDLVALLSRLVAAWPSPSPASSSSDTRWAVSSRGARFTALKNKTWRGFPA
ncbi:hypothetical protein [Amycolatopsis sp. NPDC051716]|uniref:hypothetical protein n=1 Tax=Amycolatopsis sp. NPDC051716 TaxID=3155804 RepID=UPI0034294F0E